MHKLTSSDLAELEQRLRTLRAETLDAIRAHLAPPDAGQAPSLASLSGAGDQAVEDMLTDNEIALVGHELMTLGDIDAAQRRIEFDVGGLCTQCGLPIPMDRLRAVPTAATCIACAAAHAG